MSATESTLEHAEETSKLYRETTVKIEPAGGFLRVSKQFFTFSNLPLNNMGFGSGDKVGIPMHT